MTSDHEELDATELERMHRYSQTPGTTRVDDVAYAHLLARRVAVAKDVLLQLDLMHIEAASNLYVRFHGESKELAYGVADKGGDLQAVAFVAEDADTVGGKCEACAVGAALLCHARLFDSVPLTTGIEEDYSKVFVYQSGNVENVKEALGRLLGHTFAARIEQVFEGWDADMHAAYYDEAVYDQVGSEGRMRAIMGDIVAEGGEFTMPRNFDGRDVEETDDRDFDEDYR